MYIYIYIYILSICIYITRCGPTATAPKKARGLQMRENLCSKEYK